MVDLLSSLLSWLGLDLWGVITFINIMIYIKILAFFGLDHNASEEEIDETNMDPSKYNESMGYYNDSENNNFFGNRK